MKNGMIESTYTDEKNKKYYAWRASNYDAMTEWEEPFHAEGVHLADAQAGQRILVIACGTGRGMIELAQAVGSTGRVDALDLSENMIEKARAKAEKSGLHSIPSLAHGKGLVKGGQVIRTLNASMSLF